MLDPPFKKHISASIHMYTMHINIDDLPRQEEAQKKEDGGFEFEANQSYMAVSKLNR